MSGVFQNIDPPPSPPGECVPPAFGAGEDALAGWRGVEGQGGGVNILEDARHCSVLYICKYFLEQCHRPTCKQLIREFLKPRVLPHLSYLLKLFI
jgi:hypothetical protein